MPQNTLNMLNDKSTLLIRQWLGTIRQQAIIWANADPHLCRHYHDYAHMASLGYNELRSQFSSATVTDFTGAIL